MHVWLVTDVYPPECGGSGWSTHALARVLAAQGHRVQVFVVDPGRRDASRREYDGVTVTDVGVQTARRRLRARLGAHDYAYDCLSAFLDQRLRDDPSVDVIHGQHLHSGPPSVAVGLRHGRATVVTVRDYWPVCLHGTAWWGGTRCDRCTTANLTGCLTEYLRWPRPVAWAMAPWARRRIGARAAGLSPTQVVAVSQAVKQRIQAQVAPSPVTVIPNIVDPSRLVGSPPPAGVGREPYLLAAGKLQPTKGFDLLLDFLGRLGVRLPLIVAGDGRSRPALEAQARDAGLVVRFLGWVDHDTLVGLQREALAVLLPSAWEEPLSRVALETMAVGTPLVAWARGGNLEILETGATGWLVRDPVDLGRALDALRSPAERQRIGTAARRCVLERYAPAAVYPQLERVYTRALAAARDAAGA